MPVHDWSRVRSGRFHHFHNSWIYKLSDRLNSGLLPAGFYAAGEQVAGGWEPDVLALEERESRADWQDSANTIALAEQPPKGRGNLAAVYFFIRSAILLYWHSLGETESGSAGTQPGEG